MSFVIIASGGEGFRTLDNTIPQVYNFDATVSLTSRRTANVTSHPVEGGSTASEHVVVSNTIVDLVGIIVQIPMPKPYHEINRGNDVIEASRDGLDLDRIHAATDVLVKVFNDRELITISSEIDVFPNCIITSLNLPRTAEIGDTLRIEMTLEQLQIIQLETTEVSKEIFDSAAANKKIGGTSSVDSDNPDNSTTEKTVLSSVEKQLANFSGSLGSIL
jgi:hypothetical protein